MSSVFQRAKKLKITKILGNHRASKLNPFLFYYSLLKVDISPEIAIADTNKLENLQIGFSEDFLSKYQIIAPIGQVK